MLEIDIGQILPSAIGGGAIGAAIFGYQIGKKVGDLTTEIKNLNKKINDHVDHPPTCPAHTEIVAMMAVIKSKQDAQDSKGK